MTYAYRKLQRLGSKEPLSCHYNTVLASLLRVLGSGSTEPGDYKDADLYAEKYLSYNLRRKEATPYGVVVDETARRAETLNGFLARESLNRRINQERTFGYSALTGEYTSDELGLRMLYRAREIILDLVGHAPNLEEVAALADFGNGASATLVRAASQRPRKFEHGLSATSGLLKFAELLVNSSPAWTRLLGAQKDTWYVDSVGNTSSLPRKIERYAGGVLDQVPKDSGINRIIIKEPELNGFVQKGIGKLLRRKLREYRRFTPDGMDLNTSGDLNKDLARAGSVDGHIGTVDGERASDSITVVAVEFLFPPKWVELLMAARSPYVLINGRWHRCEMMSGMGNGFTFELESIMFYAIGLACAEKSRLPFAEMYVSIHGDDLTIPADVMALVREAYAALGITINKSKSFTEGPFRESCGGHWFKGRSVKPFFVKRSTGLSRGDWCWLANSLLLWLKDRSNSYLQGKKGKDLVAHSLYLRDYSRSYDDRPNVFVSPFDRSRRSGIYSRPVEARGAWFKCRHIVDEPVRNRYTDEQSYVAWLHSPQVSPTVLDLLYHERPSGRVYEFNEEVHEREKWVHFSKWPVPCNGDGWPALWAAISLHEGRRF